MRKAANRKFLITTFFFMTLLFASLKGKTQCNLLNENFNSPPVLSNSNINGAWYPDRFRPAAFTSAILGSENVLKISIDGIGDGVANRPPGQNGTFYNTQGRKINQCSNCVTRLSGDLWIPADWATDHRRSDMWASAFDAGNSIVLYPIIGFRNIDGGSPGIYYWDGGTWVNSGIIISYDSWYKFDFRLNGSNLEYRVNNNLVGTISAAGATYFGDIIMQAYNFNDPTLPVAQQSADSYDAYWDNLITTGTGGTAVMNMNSGESFCSIQAAIDDAQTLNGHTLSVGPGTYVENVIVNKSLTINGAGQTNTIIVPAISAPNPDGCAGSICAGSSNVILVQANNVVLHDLTVDGDNPALTSSYNVGGANIDARNGIITNHAAGIFQNLEIYNVTVKNIYLRGIYASSGGSFNFHDNTITNVKAEIGSIGMFNFGGSGFFTKNTVSDCNDAISSNHSKGTTYSGNTVTQSGSGIHTDNNGSSGGTADIIENNTVSNSLDDGYGIFVFVAYKNVVVQDNTITNVEVGLTCAGSYEASASPIFRRNKVDAQNKADAIGVYSTTEIWGYPSGNQKAVFTNNFIHNVDKAFLLASQAGFTNSTHANENSVVGHTIGVKLVRDYTEVPPTGAFALDFTCNWWGTYSPTIIAAKIPGTVPYSPWLTSGIDNNPATIGFQPLTNSCQGTPTMFNDYMCGKKKDKKVYMCHSGSTICISSASLQTHFDHGDVLGQCEAPLVKQNGNPEQEDLVEAELPVEFKLFGFPNPFNGVTRIMIELPEDSKVSVRVIDAMGREVSILLNERRKAGMYPVEFNAAGLAPGMYYAVMVAESGGQTIRRSTKLIKQ